MSGMDGGGTSGEQTWNSRRAENESFTTTCSVQFEPKSLGELPLLLVKRVRMICTQIEGRCHMAEEARC